MMSDALSLVHVDLLKLRRRRGLMALTSTIAVGGVGVMFAVLAARHASSPLQYGPAGGIKNFDNATDFVGLLGVVVAAMIGATAGAGDAESGILRDLVATGRSRVALFVSRATGGLIVTTAILATALAVTTICSIVLAGALPAPSLGHIVEHDAAVLAFGAVSALVSAGIATFTGSRGSVIAVVIAFGLIISQLLLHISFLGDVRSVLPLEAFERLAGDQTPGLHPSLVTAMAVLVGWVSLALGSGAWWTRRVEV
jgi:ABC-type transport system involved in multi-copper enzyme maturation permease subunit